jgi:hypothetical protein
MAARLEAQQPPVLIRGRRPVQMVLVTSPARMAADPAQFFGVSVSVQGRVANIYNPHVFTLEQHAWWWSGADVPVLIPTPRGGAMLEPNEYVTVVGTVRPFVRAELERDYDWFGTMPEIDVELQGRSVIVADSARTSGGVTLAQPATAATRVLVASAGAIADTPGRFLGHPVSVTAEVEDVWSPWLFTLDEDEWFAGPDVLVLNRRPVATGTRADQLEGERVRVTGIVRPLIVSEFEADYAWFDAADYRVFDLERLERRPVVVASSIVGENTRELVQFRSALVLDVAEAQLAPRMEQWQQMAQQSRPSPAPGVESSQPQREERGTTRQQESRRRSEPRVD